MQLSGSGQRLVRRGRRRLKGLRELARRRELLARSEATYRAIIDELWDGYYEVDLAGNFTAANLAMCDLLGYRLEELLGLNNRAYMETYLDGVSLGQNEGNVFTTGSTLLRNLNGRLILGGHNSAGRSATGRLDDFALFDFVVSDADILAIAEGRLSPADFIPGNIIPEPSTVTLATLGLLWLAFIGWRRRGR